MEFCTDSRVSYPSSYCTYIYFEFRECLLSRSIVSCHTAITGASLHRGTIAPPGSTRLHQARPVVLERWHSCRRGIPTSFVGACGTYHRYNSRSRSTATHKCTMRTQPPLCLPAGATPPATHPRSKRVHFVRHGEGEHNTGALHMAFGIRPGQRVQDRRRCVSLIPCVLCACPLYVLMQQPTERERSRTTPRSGLTGRRPDCHSAAPHSSFSRCFNMDVEGTSTK